MDLLDYIIKYMNNKVEAASSIFTKTYGLSEIAQSKNIKSYAHYIGNGQLEVITNFDAEKGTLFWIRRGDTTLTNQVETQLRATSCNDYVALTYPLRAICVVKKEHLPCDNATAVDQIAQEMLHKLGGKDKVLKSAIGAVTLNIAPIGYTVNIQGLPLNKEYAAFGLDYNIQIVYPQSCIPSICEDIALPPTPIPTPRKGTITVQDEGVIVSSDANTLNFVGSGVVATLESAGVVKITISGGGGSILLQTDGVDNGSQTLLNLKQGENITLTDDGSGGVTIAASGGGGGAVDSVNGQTGVVVLDTDDISDTTTNRYTNDTDIARLANTSGTNTGDQDLSGLAAKATLISTNSPLSGGGDISANRTLSIAQANASTDGYLSSSDWNTFNDKFDEPTGDSTQYLDGAGVPRAFPSIPRNIYIQDTYNAGTISTSIECVPSLNKLFVANSGTANINIFDTISGDLSTTVPAGSVSKIKYIASVNEIWVCNSTTSIIRIDAATNGTLTSISGVTANGVDILEYSASKVYITYSGGSSGIMLFDPSTATLTTTITTDVPTFTRSLSLNTNAVSPQFGFIAVVSSIGIALLDPSTDTISTTATNPSSLLLGGYYSVYSPSQDTYYVASAGNQRIVAIAVASATTFTATSVQNQFNNYDINIDDDLGYIFTLPMESGASFNCLLKIYDLSTLQPLMTLKTPCSGGNAATSGYICVDSINKSIYIAGRNTNTNNTVATVKYS